MLLPHQRRTLAWGCHSIEHAMSQNFDSAIAIIGIKIGCMVIKHSISSVRGECGASTPANQKEGFHWTFSFDVDDAVRFQPKALVDMPMGCS